MDTVGSVIIILGPPGAGKGTQSDILAQQTGAVHLSSGQILRDSGNAAVVAEISVGNLAKTDDFLAIVGAAIKAVPPSKKIILDAVGRKGVREATWLVGLLRDLGRTIERVVYLTLDQEQAVVRNLKRGEQGGRQDDSYEAQQVRWKQYQSETLPVVDYYRQLGLLEEVDGDGSVEEVAERIKKALG